jgi:hypothetical protein
MLRLPACRLTGGPYVSSNGGSPGRRTHADPLNATGAKSPNPHSADTLSTVRESENLAPLPDAFIIERGRPAS